MERDASGAVVITNIKPSLGSAVMKSTWRWKIYGLAREEEQAAALDWQASAEDVATPDNRAIVLGLIAKGRDEGQPWHSAVRAQRSTRLEPVLAERFGMGLKDATDFLNALERECFIRRAQHVTARPNGKGKAMAEVWEVVRPDGVPQVG
jgi:hypothetical protein